MLRCFLKTRPSERSAFTLLEVCIAVFIGVMLVMMALPTLSGIVKDRKAEASFDQFDDLVKEVRRRSIAERQPYVMIWAPEGVVGKRDGADDAEEDEVGRFALGKEETLVLELPAAMKKNPEWIWTFWPNGACEPAVVRYGKAGVAWSAVYDPFTANATVTYE